MIVDTPWMPAVLPGLTATAATSAEAIAGLDATKYVSPATLAAARAVMANPRAPRQALALDGTAGGGTFTLTSALGSNPLTYAQVFLPTQWAVQYLLQGGSNSLGIAINASGFIEISVPGVAVRLTTTATAPVGVVSFITVTRDSAGVWTAYLNGVACGTATTAIDNLTPTFYYLGQSSVGGNIFTGNLYGQPYLENRALTAAEVLALYQEGAPRAADYNNDASNTAKYTSDFSTGLDGWLESAAGGTTLTGNIDGIAGQDNCLRATRGTSGILQIWRNVTGSMIPLGRRYRVTFDYYAEPSSGLVGSAFALGVYGGIQSNTVAIVDGVWTSVTLEHNAPNTHPNILTSGALAAGKSVYLRNIKIYALGLLCAPDANQQGRGLTWYDMSGNNAHLTLPASGVRWAVPSTSRITDAEMAVLTNTKSARGGVAFDGTASTRAYSLLGSAGAIGADAFSLVGTFKVPLTQTFDVEILALSASATSTQTGSSFAIMLSYLGTLAINMVNAAGSASRNFSVPGFMAKYAGKVVQVAAVRSGNTVSVYVDGVLQTGTDSGNGTGVNWSDTITSTYLISGFRSSSVCYTGVIYTESFYNLALTQADVTEIYELGGAVPERFKFGSQAALYTSNFTAGVDGWTEYAGSQSIATGNIDAIAGVDDCLRIARNTTGYIQYASPPGAAVALNRAYRLTFDYYMDASSGVPSLGYAGGFGANATVSVVEGSWQTGKVLDWLGFSSTIHYFTGIGGNLAVGKNLYLKNAVAKRIGAVVHLDGDSDGLGYQWHDQSTNKLDAVLTTTGVTWTKPVRAGYLRAFSDGTTSAQQLTGATSLPANCQLIRIRARSITGTPSITLGSSSGGSQYVASVALTTAWKNLTIALTDGMVTANSAVWLTASAANVVEVQIAYETLA